MRIAKDLEFLKYLKQQDSINISTIALQKKQIDLDSIKINILDEKLSLQSQIINGLNDKSSLQQTVSNEYKSQAKTMRWERNGAILIAVGLIVKLIIK